MRAAICAARDGVGVVGQDHDLGGTGGVDGLEEHARGRPAAGSALDDDRAGLAEQPGETGSGGHGHDPASGPCGQAAGGGLDLLGEVRDPDPVGAAGGDPGLDRGADVVDVDVDVPQTFPTHDDQRVAERGEVALELLDGVVVGVEQVHHLVRGTALVEIGGRPRHRGGNRVPAERRRPVDPVATGQDRLGRVEHDAQAATTGVDHASGPELLELLRGVGERFPGGLGGRGEDVACAGAWLPGPTYGGVGGRARDRQDRALDRHPHRRIAGVGRLDHGLGHHRGVALARGGSRDPGRDRAEHLAEDHPAVAAGPQERPAPEGGQGRGQVSPLRDGLEDGVAGGAHREVHVGARVAVRHRVDVERVDLLAGLGQGVDGDVDEALHDRDLDAAAGGCFHGLALRSVGLAGQLPVAEVSG